MIQPYATTTRTRRNIEALKQAGWRLLLTPDISNDWGMRYALDNGAYGCYLRGESFNEEKFRKLLHEMGPGADWVVVPDVVAAKSESLRLTFRWLPECQRYCKRVLLAVQDGMIPEDIIDYLGPQVGIFVGGTTDWKLETLPIWGDLSAFCECYLHVGRVNTMKRIKYCQSVGADSFDGTSATRFAVTVPKLTFASQQRGFVWS